MWATAPTLRIPASLISRAMPTFCRLPQLFSFFLALRLALCTLVASFSINALGEEIDFVRDIRPIFDRHCTECHGTKHQRSGFRLDIKAAALRGGESGSPAIVPGSPQESPLIQWVCATDASERMPPGPDRDGLPSEAIELLKAWISEGATWPDGIDLAKEKDPNTHWSFQPLRTFNAEESIDSLVVRRLNEFGLRHAPEATPMQWLRRVTLDLHGLPPSAEMIDWFSKNHTLENGDRNTAAYAQIVDDLLASPRYAERWAQHWLDVVRYADTHGFEVNTERPHAWHYRDYVIEALHRDTPYHQFIREQIAGDQLEQDTAPGFLITASVLLPGQIGADEPSKRLARQDAIDEILVNIGQSFLGLSIGCARCHDHKFDPISQKDYYAMQAFVAGVEYEDRVVNTPKTQQLRERISQLNAERETLEQQLDRFEPLVQLDSAATPLPNSALNEIEFTARKAQVIRMEIFTANRHPSLGVIEPCIDEFEIWTDEPTPQNIALATFGTTVTTSGSRESPTHQLKFIHDGIYGNASSWMSDQHGKGWVQFTLPTPTPISKITWGRDRNGQFQDRTATAYQLQVGMNDSDLEQVALRLPQRPRVQAKRNSDRFEPQLASAVRMRILATNRLEPCIDELEVFDTEGNNVALSTRGAKVSSTGDSTSPDRHELRFINDGNYGNERSWMSNQDGKGEVTIEWPELTRVERVVWGRDRQGNYSDRVAIRYLIELRDPEGRWIPVATESDRATYPSDGAPAAQEDSAQNIGMSTYVSPAGISDTELAEFKKIEARLVAIQKEIQSATEAQKAFAGKFRVPDKIHVLNRGDPEQPKEPVAPMIPKFFGDKFQNTTGFGPLLLDPESSDAARRMALANWIADSNNPLTLRVISNRIWQGHFGIGLVETSNDFGLNGTAPTNPELLDWLAQELLRGNWSLKHLHRQIVLSQTYRQSADAPSELSQLGNRIDAQSRLLWKFPRRRLEAEAIRDAMLFVSGELNTQMYGRGYDLFDQRGGLSGFNPVEMFPPEGLRRMIYAHKVRREREAVFGAFDCPDAGQSTGLRRSSTTPIQALNLLNSPFTLERSKAFAERCRSAACSDIPAQIQKAFEFALMRSPTSEELTDVIPFVEEFGLESLCRILFNTNEFLFTP